MAKNDVLYGIRDGRLVALTHEDMTETERFMAFINGMENLDKARRFPVAPAVVGLLPSHLRTYRAMATKNIAYLEAVRDEIDRALAPGKSRKDVPVRGTDDSGFRECADSLEVETTERLGGLLAGAVRDLRPFQPLEYAPVEGPDEKRHETLQDAVAGAFILMHVSLALLKRTAEALDRYREATGWKPKDEGGGDGGG